MPEIQFNGTEWEIKDALQAFYVPYASYVIQTRALPDARDGLKSGARYILYAQYKDKLTYKEKRRKAVATVNAAMRFSPHGDSSILGAAVRMSQDFSLRYPVIEVQGNNGSVLSGDDYAQSRYLEMRGNKIAWDMTNLLNKDTVDDWKLNYTGEELYPTVLPSKFPYALVNGSFGIGVACASSLPPHNIIDVCNAVNKLIENPDVSFEEIYCPIDFPTGGTIINEEAVKESLKNGTGKAALIRADIEYVEKDNELVVRQIPYMTFTNTIIGSINGALEEGLINGIENVTDGTDFEGCKIYIKLAKNSNVKKIVRLLYKHTALQSSFSINMNMLENGKIPKLFTWKEAMEAYVSHLRDVIVKAYQFDLNKLKDRIHILDGLIIAYQNIEEVVKTIRAAASTTTAKDKLIEKFNLTETQADAILKMKLSSLTHLEIEKLEKEKSEKELEKDKIELILSSEDNIKKEMIKEVESIKNEYGDSRRTTNINLDFSSDEEDAEPIEKRELLIYLTNLGNIYTQESTTLMKTKRGGKGSKIKMGTKEYVVKTIKDDNFSTICAFSNTGTMYSCPTSELPVNDKINTKVLFELNGNETINTIVSFDKHNANEYITFVTKNGFVKKTAFKEYRLRKGKSLKAINLDNDEVVSVFVGNDTRLAILTEKGLTINIDVNEVAATGRATKGVIGIKLNKNDSVIDAKMISKGCKYIVTLSKSGLIKKADIADFPLCSRATKGKKISDVVEDDDIVGFLTLNEDSDIIITTKKKIIKFSTSELRVLSRAAVGVKAITVDDGDKAITLAKED